MQRIRYSRYLKTIIILLDLLVIAGVFVFFFLSYHQDLVHEEGIWSQNLFSLLLLISFWILLSGRTKIYNIARNLSYIIFIERLIPVIYDWAGAYQKSQQQSIFQLRTYLALTVFVLFYICYKICCIFCYKISAFIRDQPQKCHVSV